MKNITILLISIFFVLILGICAFADIGPKPTMRFQFTNETNKPVTIVKGQQLECKNSDCSKYKPLKEYGPQRFVCDDKLSCRSLAYGYPSDKHKLVIEFSDKIRESNVFEAKAYDAIFNVKITDDALVVEELIPKEGLVTKEDATREFNEKLKEIRERRDLFEKRKAKELEGY